MLHNNLPAMPANCLFGSDNMYAIYVDVLDFFCFNSVNVQYRLGFRRGYVNFKHYAVLIDTHVADMLVCVIFPGNTDIVENNIICIGMIEAHQNFVFIIHSDYFPDFFEGHIGAFIFTFVKKNVCVAVIEQQ